MCFKFVNKQVIGKYHIHHCHIVYWVKWCFTIHKKINLSTCIWRDLVRFGEIQWDLVRFSVIWRNMLRFSGIQWHSAHDTVRYGEIYWYMVKYYYILTRFDDIQWDFARLCDTLYLVRYGKILWDLMRFGEIQWDHLVRHGKILRYGVSVSV